MKILSLFFIILTALSCSELKKIKSTNGNFEFSDGIIYGSPILQSEYYKKSIVGIFNIQTNSFCTATLVGANTAITAAHCVSMNTPSTLKIIFHHDMSEVLSSMNFDSFSLVSRAVEKIIVHPNWFEERGSEDVQNFGDIALVKFQGEIPSGFSFSEFLLEDLKLEINQEIMFAGFGVFQAFKDEISYSKSETFQKLKSSGKIKCTEMNDKCYTVQFVGDGPLRKGKAPILYLYATEFRLDEKKLQGTCSGDSGGPAYIKKNDQYFLVGITSRGSPNCDATGVYTMVSKYLAWILENK